MGKNLEPQYAFRCDEVTIKKLEYIANQNTRTRNQEMKHIIKEYIARYEAEHGEIEVKARPTRSEAMDDIKETLGQHKKLGIKETAMRSLKAGFDFGNADK